MQWDYRQIVSVGLLGKIASQWDYRQWQFLSIWLCGKINRQ